MHHETASAPSTRSASHLKQLVFEDAESAALLRRIEHLGPCQASVLLLGETGTGKELIARQLHELSARRACPFVAVNCGALTESLVESELFGHERGAFTGATCTKPGWFEAAHGGTLFLDEIGELSLATQVKLLRVLQEGEVVRLGSREPRSIDVRLIAATNVPLQEAVDAGRFRADLYYRLNVVPLHIPPLRERRGDIVPLAQHFLKHYAPRLKVSEAALAPDAIETLLAHPWPGNIRELENVIHRALVVRRDGRIGAEDLQLPEGATLEEPATVVRPRALAANNYHEALDTALRLLFEAELPNLFQYIEERAIRTALLVSGRNQVQTARLLGMSRNVVRARLIQYGEISPALRASES